MVNIYFAHFLIISFSKAVTTMHRGTETCNWKHRRFVGINVLKFSADYLGDISLIMVSKDDIPTFSDPLEVAYFLLCYCLSKEVWQPDIYLNDTNSGIRSVLIYCKYHYQN
jgi:hypothetical protein